MKVVRISDAYPLDKTRRRRYNILYFRGAAAEGEWHMERITDYFGCMVFDDRVMKKMLSEEVYSSLRKTVDEGEQLDIAVASAVAEAMKTWWSSTCTSSFVGSPSTGAQWV